MKKLTKAERLIDKKLKERDNELEARINKIKSGRLHEHFLFFLIKKGLGSAELNADEMESELNDFEKEVRGEGA